VVHGRVWHARWIRVAGYFAFWKVWPSALPNVDAPVGHARWRSRPNRPIRRHRDDPHHAPGDVAAHQPNWQQGRVGQLAILTLVPQALIVAITMGMVVGILAGLRGRVATLRVKRSLAALVLPAAS
jgi:hypothetical protein